jgi:hypothetical protein
MSSATSPHHRIPFHFHAEGHGFSGEFRHPGRHLIQAQAATSLPTIGGQARAHVDHFHYEDFVSFRTAHTEVSGRKIDENTFKTHATAIIEDLNILDVVTADRIVARLTSTHDPKDPEGRIVADGSEFHNLRIAGHAVNVILRHKILADCAEFKDLGNQIATDKKQGRITGQNSRAAICSLVDKIVTTLPGVDPVKHVLTVPNFGKISIAEIFAEPGTRTLTMLHLQLGSPHVADLTAAETRTNGQPPPPKG